MLKNETLETLKARRSCRDFKPEQIKDEELDAILEAGTYALRVWENRVLL